MEDDNGRQFTIRRRRNDLKRVIGFHTEQIDRLNDRVVGGRIELHADTGLNRARGIDGTPTGNRIEPLTELEVCRAMRFVQLHCEERNRLLAELEMVELGLLK